MATDPFTIGSVFSGIGGLEAGLEAVIPNARTLWQVEIDQYARRVLAKHWPNTKRYEDVKQVGASTLAPVDLICGGFPCQDISPAGSHTGLEGDQSGLWTEFSRLIGEIQPNYVIVENVAALFHRGMGDVLGDLARHRYDAIWDCVSAASAGAAHRRRRVFIIAFRDLPNTSGFRLQDSEQAWATAKATARTQRDCWWSAESGVLRTTDGLPARVDRLRCIGNAVCPPVAQVVGHVFNHLRGVAI
jgi:DNA (cytosine-5)-methyltransferase 1